MSEAALTSQLQRDGFSHAYVWEDDPNARYPGHTHRTETAHIILTGEMTLTMAGESRTFRSGERCDVPSNTATGR
jgi:mannose-6-phosphate isomerase-like protein (cupin superfamily)